MLFVPLGIASLVAAAVVWLITLVKGGADAALTVSGVVLTGPMLYAIAALLAVAGVMFIISGVIKVIRRFAVTVAMVAVVAGGGVAALVPDGVSDFVAKHCAPGEQGASLSSCYKSGGNP